jgi:uncharacterized protein
MLLIKAAVKPSPIHGLGCYTLENIADGQIVWEFHPSVDRVFSLNELAQLPPPIISYLRTYAWFNPEDCVVLFSGDHSKFFNHSDHPNTTMVRNGYACVANCNIAAGEELTSDYSQLKDIPGES